MLKIYNVKDFKTSLKVNIPSEAQKYTGNSGFIYLVPMNKNYNVIKTDYKQKYNSDNKTPLFYVTLGNPAYNGSVKVFADGTFAQYRDGSFFEYVGKIAL